MRRLQRLLDWLGGWLPGPKRSPPPTLPPEQSHKLLGTKPPPTRRFPPSLMLSFACIFLAAGFTVLMWCSHIFDTTILKLVSIRNDLDTVYDLWRFPPTRPILSVYVFNYTNIDKALSGDLPTVQEVGPYVFREKSERINIVFHDNGTVSFQENKTIVFDPSMTKGSLNDSVRVPNVPLLVMLDKFRHMDFAGQAAVSNVVLSIFNPELFTKVSVNDFIWGYEDSLYASARAIKGFFVGHEEPKYGFLAKRRGVHHTRVTMNTGDLDLDSVGTITAFDGVTKFGVWGGSKCDKLEGSDGSLFPGNKVNKKQPLYVSSHDMCRRLPIIFNESTETVDGFPVNQYNFPETLFDYSPENEENVCYKTNGFYPPGGSFYTGPCNQGAPMYITFPHFWTGDSQLQNFVHGLNPDPEKHQSSFQLHERLGLCLRARTRFQLNARYHRAKFVNHENSNIRDGTILPIAWMEYDSGPLPDHFKDIIYHLTYTVRTVQTTLKIASLLSCFMATLFLYVNIKKSRTSSKRLQTL